MLRTLIGIGLAGWIGYSFMAGAEHHQSRAAAPVLPDDNVFKRFLTEQRSPRTLKVTGDVLGQFWTPCITSNNTVLRCLIDTGASDISFGRDDARRIGIDISRLRFDGWANTANGRIRTAGARIASLVVGPFRLTDVPVTVDDSDMNMPLLGMGFLRHYKLTVSSDLLTISE
jgi:clan AA aspartic protease (TIGR02281 family)